MTARLVGLQVLVVGVLTGTALFYLVQSVSNDLDAENHEVLTEQSDLLRQWLEAPTLPTADMVQLGNLPLGREIIGQLLVVRVLDGHGKVLRKTSSRTFPPVYAFPDPGHEPVYWRTSDGPRYLMTSIGARLGATRQQVLLQAVLDVTDDYTVLRQIRQRITLLLALALVLSAGLAFLITRNALRPLAALTESAARIQASHLEARIVETGWPVELAALAREFNGMLGRLDGSFRRLARFSSDLSHELRTPINNLRGEAEVALSRPRREEEYRRVLESGLEEYARIGRLIDTLLFIAKSDHPAQGINRRNLDAAAECRAVAEFFEAQAAERNLTIQVRGSAPVHCDPELLRRALANLVDNATRHTAADGRVDMVVREKPGHGTEIEVSDTGTGIPAEHLSRVFERFYRSERSPGEADAPSGFGLGLAIVKSIMDLHGGTVSITSVPGRGTTVTLFFSGYAAAS